MSKTYREEQDAVQAAIASFPAGPTFQLAAFPGETFRISPNAFKHFYSEHSGGVQLVIEVMHGDGDQWQDFGRETPEYIRAHARFLAAPPDAQPALPGAENVRDQEIATPTYDAPFSLTPAASDRRAHQKGLF